MLTELAPRFYNIESRKSSINSGRGEKIDWKLLGYMTSLGYRKLTIYFVSYINI